MKYVFIEKNRAEFSIKAMCRVLRIARSGWYVWCLRRHQISPRQQFRLICDKAVGKAFTEAKQRYGAPRLADELPEYNIKNHCRQPATSGAAGESGPQVQSGQLS
ncbi:Transposase insF for insertion sequence IS3A/B/C/D/E/fA [Erwinia pyrifoliae DSM 12163]|nr:Transposase insF for insertion sequence IS3A/B/C/D/E/fA [Erwinia pyrifoliae DSM 12163]CAY74749.1 Transposase insF for insertion sequence IS3A/B/C/D/E/fA [Erwinia pyrifoliae DSM 12163]CAY75849.1 Transposase insF for insertion sequence IS3A/B/C/D/E/fA [Erwinia pyrifoliae DSM 12163]CAY75885.1 Transposase insF for insertion sequence IS3A/B/C/D/E/fA [Erwinia pyrifoliae DSM 12163]CAY76214.1 Transposase insF for insertion sequence IS3A/B/C/D/E/fA [Erwinia pyrifoliae DSM 12163]